MMRKKVCVIIGGQSIIFDTLSLFLKLGDKHGHRQDSQAKMDSRYECSI
mgnify:CR=1 FL=1